jgi:cysteine synthase B
MPECVSQERRRVLEAFGADLVLTPAKEGTDGAIRRAREFFTTEPDKYYLPDQFSNDANVLAHYFTTGPEVLSQTGGEIDCLWRDGTGT